MSFFQGILHVLSQLVSWWFVVLPWEQAVRVRAGNRVRLYEAGLHFRVPFIDYVWIQNTRRRASGVDAQTLSTRDGKTVTVAGSLAYRVDDVMALQKSLHQAAQTLAQIAAGACSKYVITHSFAECTPEAIVAAVNAAVGPEFKRIGLGDAEYFLTDFLTTNRTYRLVQNSVGTTTYYGDSLTTTQGASNVPAGVGMGAPR